MVAYGALVPPAALEIPAVGWVNLHFSILPAWRGAAPVQHAMLAGDDLTGASTFLLEAGLDTGPVFGVMTTVIGPRDTAGELLERLAVDGAALLTATLDGIEDGTVTPVPQPADGISLAPKLTTADARVDWSAAAIVVDRQVRACTPAPGAWTAASRQAGRARAGAAAGRRMADLAPGEIRRRGAGRRPRRHPHRAGPARRGADRKARPAMAAADWARGLRLRAGRALRVTADRRR